MAAPPNVLVLSGHDPSGGAGFQADLEAIGALGAHPAGVLTALTRQDTHDAYDVWPIPDERFAAMLDTLTADMPFAAIKVGLLGSPGQARCITDFRQTRPGTALVVDPVLRAGGGGQLAADPVARALIDVLLPIATLSTPNAGEARLLCPDAADLDDCGRQLSRGQPGWVLITGGDEPGDTVTNSLFHDGAPVRRFHWPRQPHRFHGSGCTLAAAAAARLAAGDDVPAAVAAAQQYVADALAAGFMPGGGQMIPGRLPRRAP
ncbi:hydroxymethylpyrimidine/phosphomethylpyrimidine kinase [Spectribacter hydrogenoxidans]|uniref:hydroxymethylpyrimidine kinase n=1 Tax=Spectribacter hydrogenoxidans TaxID=3075608 RepID=A0ABU3BYC7_9GAMM|nr:hydroxymethylpyrimidine/phosphomethylpyrimidine kinase [Salinisphaera sp. W335]MDT0634270.1 hydroxymethylpyrimidine/phosphomethylpyrimidine kinase [Salinisphaera sp. W335]